MKTKLLTIAMTAALMLTAMTKVQAQNFEGPCLPQMHGMVGHQSALCGITQSIALIEGWNNISLFIEVDDPVVMLDMLKEGLGDNAVVIEGNDGYTTYEDGEWFGELDEIGLMNVQSYTILVSADCTVELQGMPANPADYEITINPGWNRIGFPSAEELEIAVALAEFEAEDEDVIDSPLGYTTYDSGEWFGEIETLVPGVGYQYFSNSNEVKTFFFQTAGLDKAARAVSNVGKFSGKPIMVIREQDKVK